MTDTPKKKRGRPPKARPATARAVDPLPELPNVTRIKKYGNRRLYDTKRSRYVTLEELKEVISKGEEIQVVEETTGEDVTKRVMTQIILQEEESKHLNLLPLNFLKRLIQYRDESIKDYFQKYLQFSMDAYTNAQRTMEQRLGCDPSKGGPGQPPVQNPLMPFFQMPPFFQVPGMPQPPAPQAVAVQPPPPPAPPAGPGETVADEVADLRRRLAELEARTRR